MSKIATWFLSTLSVVVLLFAYHTSTSGPLATTAPTSIYSGTTSSGASDPTTPAPTTTTDPSTSTSTEEPSQTTPSSSPTATPATTVTGTVAPTQWGDVQVALTVKDGTITNVDVPVYPSGNGRDAEINSYALPVLIQETLDAQSAKIDMVSGATVTSDGYLQSLQSALDQAGL